MKVRFVVSLWLCGSPTRRQMSSTGLRIPLSTLQGIPVRFPLVIPYLTLPHVSPLQRYLQYVLSQASDQGMQHYWLISTLQISTATLTNLRSGMTAVLVQTVTTLHSSRVKTSTSSNASSVRHRKTTAKMNFSSSGLSNGKGTLTLYLPNLSRFGNSNYFGAGTALWSPLG